MDKTEFKKELIKKYNLHHWIFNDTGLIFSIYVPNNERDITQVIEEMKLIGYNEEKRFTFENEPYIILQFKLNS